jgi:hypothetical protein
VAPPGYSEHHTGWSLDIGDESAANTDTDQSFEKQKFFCVRGLFVNYNNFLCFSSANAAGEFTDSGISLPGLSNSFLTWGDYDNDGDLDISLTGYTGSEWISKIYCNNGDNNFTEQTGISLADVQNCTVAWGDYDNDGYLNEDEIDGVDNDNINEDWEVSDTTSFSIIFQLWSEI